MKTLQFALSMGLLVLTSCAVRVPLDTKITADQAARIMEQLAGTSAPERKLYHTYEETYQIKYWSKKGGSSTETSTYSVTLTKIEGNYVEGRVSYKIYDNIGSYPVFGRFNFTHLYLFNSDPNAEWPVLLELQIGQNARILSRSREVNKTINGVLQWVNEPPHNVDMYPNEKKYDKFFASTGYVSKTDDFIGETGKNAVAAQSLTDKLQELKGLLDAQLISQEEYDKARGALLAQ